LPGESHGLFAFHTVNAFYFSMVYCIAFGLIRLNRGGNPLAGAVQLAPRQRENARYGL
jgi:hypothetical protein